MTGRVFALCNQKGGVGKTTITVGLAQTLADAGLRVLVIDADPQANATANLGVVVTEDTLTLNDVLLVDPRSGRVKEGCAQDAAILITEPRAASVDGVAQIVATLDIIRQHYNHGLEIAGIVINRHNPQRLDRVDWAEAVQSTYQDLVLDPFVPEREAISQATSGAVPVSSIGTESARSVVDALTQVAARIVPHAVAAAS